MLRLSAFTRYHCKKTNSCGKIILYDVKCTCPTCNLTCKDFQKKLCKRMKKEHYVCNGRDEKINRYTIAHKYAYNAGFTDRKYWKNFMIPDALTRPNIRFPRKICLISPLN